MGERAGVVCAITRLLSRGQVTGRDPERDRLVPPRGAIVRSTADARHRVANRSLPASDLMIRRRSGQGQLLRKIDGVLRGVVRHHAFFVE